MKQLRFIHSKQQSIFATNNLLLHIRALLLSVAITTCGAQAFAATTYTMTEALGTFADGTIGNVVSDPYAMNQQGQIVGQIGASWVLYDPPTSSFTNLTASPGMNAIGINASGQVAGRSGTLGPIVRNADGSLIRLTAPLGYTPWWPTAINDNGFSVGMVRESALVATYGQVCTQRAVLWDPAGNGQVLGKFPAVPLPWSYARGLNSVGQVVGQSAVGNSACGQAATTHAFVTTPTGLKDLHSPGLLTFTSGRNNSVAFAINDQGIAVGQHQSSGFFEPAAGRAVLWNTVNDTFVLFGDGTLDSSLTGINNSGTVVGYEGNRAMVGNATGGPLVELDTLVPSKPATVHFTKAVAINDAGRILVRGSNTLTLSGGAFLLTPITAPVALPAAPSGLSAAAASSTQINLKWTDNASNETAQLLERCAGAGCSNFAQIASLGANITTYTDNSVTAATAYSYRIQAHGTTGDSAYSNTVSATTPPVVSATLPAAPTNLVSSAVSRSQIVLNWTDNANNETSYLIERCKGSGCTTFSQISSVGANVTTYSNTALRSNSNYSYRVRASNAVGKSAYSNIISVKTLP
jgi:probable HAF family extracellular repeat protein